MYEYELENEDKDLKKVGLELMFMTPEKCEKPDGITSIELAKLVGLPVEVVKKKFIEYRKILDDGIKQLEKNPSMYIQL